MFHLNLKIMLIQGTTFKIDPEHKPITLVCRFVANLSYIRLKHTLPSPPHCSDESRSVTGAGYHGSRVTDGLERLVISVTAGLTECTGSARFTVFPLCCPGPWERAAGAEQHGGQPDALWLRVSLAYGSTQDCLSVKQLGVPAVWLMHFYKNVQNKCQLDRLNKQ